MVLCRVAISKHLVLLIERMYGDNIAVSEVAGRPAAEVRVKRRIRQMSGSIFALALDPMIC